MSIKDKIINEMAEQMQLTDYDYERLKYGFMVLYINISKTIILIVCAIILGIIKETAILFFAFSCVRLTGFGPHSDSTIKCTIVGLIQFIGGTYLAMLLPSFSIITCMGMYLLSILVCSLYAPIATKKRPISDTRRKFFKITTLMTVTGLFLIALCMGETLYRNLIIIGVLVEDMMLLPIMKKIIL